MSGGNHKPQWPEEAQRFLCRVLGTEGNADRYSYAFVASELGRESGFFVDRGQVRHWALDHGIKGFLEKPRVTPHVRRWQRTSIGELWQLDATPDYFFGREHSQLHLIDMLDDCSRFQVGCPLYGHERVDSYLHLFYRAFMRYGLPLQIYADKATFFCRDEGLTVDTPLEAVNDRMDSLVDYRNCFEVHSEIRMTPRKAWDKAIAEGRTKIRPVQDDGWWELVWSQWGGIVIGSGGKAVVDGMWCSTGCPNGTRGWVCRHVDGTFSIVLNKPEHGVRPRVVFSSNPRVRGV